MSSSPTGRTVTNSSAPVRIRRSPRLILVARDFHGRTGSAFEFLIENGLPVKLVRVSLYEDQEGRRFVDVEGEHEPEFPSEGPEEGGTETVDPTKIGGRRVRLSDLVDAGMLTPGQGLVWDRPRLGASYRATVTDSGGLRLDDGREFAAPSRAAMEAASIPACDGWYCWRIDGGAGELLHDLRVQCVAAHRSLEGEVAPEGGEGTVSEAEALSPTSNRVPNDVPNQPASTPAEGN